LKRPIAIRRLHPLLRLDRPALVRALRVLDAHHPELATPASVLGHPGELSVAFLTDEALARLHGQFLADPSPTDVITFPGGPPPGPAGEICVSADAARRQGKGRPAAAELTLYVVHGWLHLAGHDDLAPAPRRAMRRAEAAALALLRRARALPSFSFQPSSARG
jgi:probable rRNA maturation factor